MIRVERATEDDLAAIYAIDRACGGHHQADLEKALLARQLYVARRGEDVPGLAIFNTAFFDRYFIALLLVAPEYRRQGVATALMRHLEAICPGDRLFTSTNQSNTPMQALCEKLGYRRSGIVENLDEGAPEIIYVKWLKRE